MRSGRSTVLLAIGLGLLAAGIGVALTLRPATGHNPIEVASWIAGLLGFVLSVISWFAGRPTMAQRLSTPAQVSAALTMLAREVGRQWRDEAAARGLPIGGGGELNVQWRDHDHPTLVGDLAGLIGLLRNRPTARLAILGRAGAGKTSMALQLTLALLRTRQDEDPVPALFSISGWDPVVDSLESWLLHRLTTEYVGFGNTAQFGETAAREIIVDRRIMPILDGLDELPEGHRQAAAHALRRLSDDFSFVVTSRPAEYGTAFGRGSRPTGMRCVDIVPLDPVAAVDYLADRGGWGAKARAAVVGRLDAEGEHGALGEALGAPLMVSLADALYGHADGHPAELADTTALPTQQAIEGHLIAEFVPTVYARNARVSRSQDWAVGTPTGRRDRPPRRWDPVKADAWLGFLAAQLTRHNKLNYEWWSGWPGTGGWIPSDRAPMRGALGWKWAPFSTQVGTAMNWAFYAFVGPIVAVLSLVTAGRVFGLDNKPPTLDLRQAFSDGIDELKPFLRQLYALIEPAVRAVGGPAFGVLILAAAAATAGLIRSNLTFDPRFDTAEGVSPMAILRVDRRATLARALLAGLGVGLLVGSPLTVYRIAVIAGGTNAAGLWVPSVLTLIALPVAALVVCVGAVTAESAWFAFLVLRLSMALLRRAPLRLMTFLDDATRLGVLRTNGGMFQFRHGLLQQGLAGKHPSAADVRQAQEFAEVLEEMGLSEEADAITSGTATPGVRRRLAGVLQVKGRMADAEGVLARAFAFGDPGAGSALARLLESRLHHPADGPLAFGSGDRERAERAWRGAVERAEPESWEGLTSFLVKYGQAEEAEGVWAAAIKADVPLARTGLARTLEQVADKRSVYLDPESARRKVAIAWRDAVESGDDGAQAELDRYLQQHFSGRTPTGERWWEAGGASERLSSLVVPKLYVSSLWPVGILVIAVCVAVSLVLCEAVAELLLPGPLPAGRWSLLAVVALMWTIALTWVATFADRYDGWYSFMDLTVVRAFRFSLLRGWSDFYLQLERGTILAAIAYGYPLNLAIMWGVYRGLFFAVERDDQAWAKWLSAVFSHNLSLTSIAAIPAGVLLIASAGTAYSFVAEGRKKQPRSGARLTTFDVG
jgi:hypothetical protein